MNELIATIGTSTARPPPSRRATPPPPRPRPAPSEAGAAAGSCGLSSATDGDPQPPTFTPSQRCWTKSEGMPVTFLLIAKIRGVV